MRRLAVLFFATLCVVLLGGIKTTQAQSFRFDVRAEPQVIPANGISTASILVQVQDTGRAAISAAPVVRFVTSRGTIEGQSTLVNGVARVLLRSDTTPGTAIVTAIIGNAREEVSVDFSDGVIEGPRYLQVTGSVAYGTEQGILTGSGPCTLDWGELHIESGVRLDVDLKTQHLWAQGGPGQVVIRQGHGEHAKELRGDRLYYDLGRRRGVIRRSNTILGPARQEFEGSDFHVPTSDPIPLSHIAAPLPSAEAAADLTRPAVPPSDPTTISSATDPVRNGPDVPLPADVAPADPANAPTVPDADAPDVNHPADDQAADADKTVDADNDNENAPPVMADDLPPDEDLPAGAGGAPKAAAPLVGGAPKADGPAGGEAAKNPVSLSPAPSGAASLALHPVSLVLPGNAPQQEANNNPLGGKVGVSARSSGLRLPGSSATSTEGAVQPVSDDGVRLALVEPRTPDAGTTPTTPGTGPGNGASGPDKNEAPPPIAPHQPETPAPLPDVIRIEEPAPPEVNSQDGYWVTGKVVRVYPRDKMQFESARVYYNGGKLFGLKLYVVPLDGSVNLSNPLINAVSLNSSGGLTLDVPFYYQASGRGTGAIYLQHAPSGGFAAEHPGFQLAVDHQYYMSSRSQGRLTIDQLGQGAWNLAWSHHLQLSNTMTANFYLDMPRHTSPYLRTEISKDLRSMQLGFEGIYTRPGGGLTDDALGQFFARLRPRAVGHTGWTYNIAATVTGQRHFLQKVMDDGDGGIGDGGIGLPGQGGGSSSHFVTRPRLSQALNLTLQSPNYQPWGGANFSASLLGVAYNSSIGGRGLAPGALLSFSQRFGRIASLQLNYTYDRSQTNIYGANFTHFVSGTAVFAPFDKVSMDAYFSKSLVDDSLYATSSLEYAIAPKWRVGTFTDLSQFGSDRITTYGLSVGRLIGARELSVNWDSARGRIYFEFGGLTY